MSIVKRSNSITVSKSVINGKSAYEIAVENGFIGTEEEWMESLNGKHFIVSADSYSYKRNQRLTGSQPIKFSWQLSGTSETPTFSLTGGYRLSNDFILEVPYSTAPDEIVVTASVTGYEPQTIILTCTNETEYDAFLGVMSFEPTELSATEALVVGDYFVANGTFGTNPIFSDGHVYTKTLTGWSELTDSDKRYTEKMLSSLSGVLSSGIEIKDKVCALYGYFQRLIAQEAVIGELNATKALFENIHVTGNSEFEGKITSTAFSTTLHKEGDSVTNVSVDSTAVWCYEDLENQMDALNLSEGWYTTGAGSTHGSFEKTSPNGAYVYKCGVRNYANGARVYQTGGSSRLKRVRVIYRYATIKWYSETSPTSSPENGLNKSWSNSSSSYKTVDITFGKNNIGYDYIDVLKNGSSGTGSYEDDVFIYNPDVVWNHRYVFFETYGLGNNKHTDDYENYTSQPKVSILLGGKTITPPYLYRLSTLPTGTGGTVEQGSTLSFENRDGSKYCPEGTEIMRVEWSQNWIRFTTTQGDEFVAYKGDYLKRLSANFTISASSDSVVVANTYPKNSTSTIGDQGKEFLKGYFKTVYGDVNSREDAGTYKVWGAVFN